MGFCADWTHMLGVHIKKGSEQSIALNIIPKAANNEDRKGFRNKKTCRKIKSKVNNIRKRLKGQIGIALHITHY